MDPEDCLYDEVRKALEKYQPKLTATYAEGDILVEGTFVCMSASGPFDEYSIRISVPRSFPEDEPEVRETSGRIPHTVGRHVFPSSGRCCLGHWAVWLLRSKTRSFEEFLVGHLTSYFVGQSIYELGGGWPFGEEGHTKSDISAAYKDALGLADGANELEYARLLASPLLHGNPRCPCGSGERFRDCHRPKLKELRKKHPASIRKEIYKRISRYTANK